MKTTEFIRRVESIGYKTEKVYSLIIIHDPNNMMEEVALVNVQSERQPSIDGAIYDLKKLLITYAETPINER